MVVIIVMGRDQNFLTWVRSIFVAQVRLGKLSVVWVRKISPKNSKFCKFFHFGTKKITSGWVKKYPGQRRFGLLFLRVNSMLRSSLGPSLGANYLTILIIKWLKNAEPSMQKRSKGNDVFEVVFFGHYCKNIFFVTHSIHNNTTIWGLTFLRK